MKSDLLRVATIGFGARKGIAECAHRDDLNSALVACADPDPKVREAFAEKYGPNAFVTDDYRRVLDRKDIDAVFILSPDYLHEEHTIAALEAGKSVYGEKPMAITLEGCDRMLRAARDTGAKLYVGHNMRHHSVIVKMKQLIESGAIGQVQTGWCRHFVAAGGDWYFKDWHAERNKANSLLLQKACHDIDLLHWLCGGYTKRTVAMGRQAVYHRATNEPAPEDEPMISLDHWPPLSNRGLNPARDVEDMNLMIMELDNGVQCSYQHCHFAPDLWRNYTIIGDEGRIENFNDRPGESVVRVWNRRTNYNAYGDEQHFLPRVTGGHGGADPLIVEEFIRYVRDGGPVRVSPLSARASVAAGCAAAHSLRNGNVPVDVPAVDEDLRLYFERDFKPDLGGDK